MICLSRQLAEVNLFQYELSVEWKGVFSDIVDDKRGVEYTLYNGMKVGVGLEQPVGCKLTILSANLRDVLSLITITRRFLTRQELQKRCICDVP